MTWVLDLDGVVWLADEPIPGAAAAVADLRARGERAVFVTNNSSMTVGDYVEKLRGHGIDVPADDIVTSAQAAATLVSPRERVLVLGGPGVVEALGERGADVEVAGSGQCDGAFDAVVVGWHRGFDFEMLSGAVRAVLAGARLVGTNSDATYPTPTGLLPGAGSILAAVAYASGSTPVVAGKPNPPMAQLLVERLGSAPELVVGDRLDTDGALADALGSAFALVLSGVAREAPPGVIAAADLAALVAAQ